VQRRPLSRLAVGSSERGRPKSAPDGPSLSAGVRAATSPAPLGAFLRIRASLREPFSSEHKRSGIRRFVGRRRAPRPSWKRGKERPKKESLDAAHRKDALPSQGMALLSHRIAGQPEERNLERRERLKRNWSRKEKAAMLAVRRRGESAMASDRNSARPHRLTTSFNGGRSRSGDLAERKGYSDNLRAIP